MVFPGDSARFLKAPESQEPGETDQPRPALQAHWGGAGRELVSPNSRPQNCELGKNAVTSHRPVVSAWSSAPIASLPGRGHVPSPLPVQFPPSQFPQTLCRPGSHVAPSRRCHADEEGVCFFLHHQRVFAPHPLNLGRMPHCGDQQNTMGGTSPGLKKPEVSTCYFLGCPFSGKAAAPLNTCLPLGGVPCQSTRGRV